MEFANATELDRKSGGSPPPLLFQHPKPEDLHRVRMDCSVARVLHNHHKSNRRASPVFFVPGTLWRTWGTRPFLIQIFPGSLLLSILLLLSPRTSAAQTTPQAALTSALQGTPAVGLVVDVKTGRQLAAVKATNERHAPGSILKPLFLAAALEQHEVQPATTVFCRRNLHINDGTHDWNLACTHPQSDVAFAAKEALAYSCNRYFAELADRIPPAQASAILEHYGLAPASIPQSREQKELLVLGVAGITVSPAQIAGAYRRLALELDQSKAPAVREGLRDSVTYGMAHNADVPGMEIAGKTGTAGEEAQARSHGWFAGTGHLDHDEVVVVIYLPLGNGADAARLAHNFFLAASAPPPESARLLTVELFSTWTVKTLMATQLGQPTPTQIDWTPSGLRLSSGTTVKQLSLSGSLRLRAGDPQEISAAGRWTITWQRDGLRVLLTLPSENYVIAALNGEAAPDEPMASLRAMAISIRTFALANANRHSEEGFGLCDSTHCQALRLGKARPEVERAVRETAGETLWFGGQRAHVYYTQHCGGMSEAAGDVWPAEQASYLAGNHADPYCLRRSTAEWHARMDLTQLSGIFRAQGWQTPSPISAIRVARVSQTGRAELLEVTGRGAPAQLSASSFRFAVDRALGWNQMRSDWYTVSMAGSALEIRGRGYGHGVGLCQAGAYEMAAEGLSDTRILSFYFPGAIAGITPAGDGWRSVPGAGWTLLTTDPAGGLVSEGNVAWARARSLFGSTAGSVAPTVQELPSTELFRQTTGEPGWMLASTRGSNVFLQPATVRQNNGGTEALLLHEFLHVLVEQQAGEQAPLWLREGLVGALANSGQGHFEFRGTMPVKELDAALARPADATASRQAHQVAARMAALLCTRYGMATVRDFLRNGVPLDTLKSLPFADAPATPNGGFGSLSGAQR
jgi:stage II sporulation protein D